MQQILYIQYSYPPKKIKAKKPEKKRNKIFFIGECRQFLNEYTFMHNKYFISNPPVPSPHTHKTKQANKQTNKYSLDV